MLDVISTDQELGKPIGSDQEQNKTTFVTLLGMEGCGQLVNQLTATALDAIAPFEQGEFHRTLAEKLATRRT